MKFLISKLELQALISKIQTIVPARPAMPILANVLLEATGDQLILSSTDLTVSMRAHANAKVSEEGAIALPAKRFFQLVRELTASEVEIETTSAEVAHIYSGSSHFKMGGLSKAEFPAFPDLSGGLKIKLLNTVLRDMLSRSSFAAARDDNRQVLNGILLQNLNREAIFVGTDGKRLARLSTTVEATTTPSSYILPLKAVEEMIKLIDIKEESSMLTLMTDKIAFETDSILLISKLLSGQYPDVGQVIPKKGESPIVLHREELMSLLRQVALFTSEESSSVRFSFSSGQLHLTAMSGAVGEGKVAMAVNYGGPKLDVAFNPHYFHDILRHSKDETVNLTLTDAFNPGLITDSTSAQFVIMPMRVDA